MSFQQLDLFSFASSTPAPTIVAPKKSAPISTPLWARAMAIPVMILAALAAGEEGRRPKFIPNGSLEGAAALAADAYSIGLCRTLDLDPDEDLAGATSVGNARTDSYEFAVVGRSQTRGTE
ncbi:hypothetical protein FY034_17225 (plasmid) [Trichlorobacter lovleyi]|uniref:hypothetical protein n=1 Tax=Trichlorobacter lovleyi TaxID=313985 RepID=UPI00224099FF|nr:hypothetical protein [Trichlorobacter lovleyi]QOX80765.1 hypothetical protein FY034_17225 [Trichlorobacter lovleyi]